MATRLPTLDTGMFIVIFIVVMYLAIVFTLLFYVKNDWCDLLFPNMTVTKKSYLFFFVYYLTGKSSLPAQKLL